MRSRSGRDDGDVAAVEAAHSVGVARRVPYDDDQQAVGRRTGGRPRWPVGGGPSPVGQVACGEVGREPLERYCCRPAGRPSRPARSAAARSGSGCPSAPGPPARSARRGPPAGSAARRRSRAPVTSVRTAPPRLTGAALAGRGEAGPRAVGVALLLTQHGVDAEVIVPPTTWFATAAAPQAGSRRSGPAQPIRVGSAPIPAGRRRRPGRCQRLRRRHGGAVDGVEVQPPKAVDDLRAPVRRSRRPRRGSVRPGRVVAVEAGDLHVGQRPDRVRRARGRARTAASRSNRFRERLAGPVPGVRPLLVDLAEPDRHVPADVGLVERGPGIASASSCTAGARCDTGTEISTCSAVRLTSTPYAVPVPLQRGCELVGRVQLGAFVEGAGHDRRDPLELTRLGDQRHRERPRTVATYWPGVEDVHRGAAAGVGGVTRRNVHRGRGTPRRGVVSRRRGVVRWRWLSASVPSGHELLPPGRVARRRPAAARATARRS